MRRRQLLLGAAGLVLGNGAFAQAGGVSRVRGAALINGQPAAPGMAVRAGDSIVTGPSSEIVFAAGGDAMLVRQNANLTLLESGFRLASGAVLAVFGPRRPRELRTSTATIGIRGTGVYLEAERTRTYACTCFGETVLQPAEEPARRETVRTRRHEQPRYIMARGAPQVASAAQPRNHSDAEIELLQKLLR